MRRLRIRPEDLMSAGFANEAVLLLSVLVTLFSLVSVLLRSVRPIVSHN
jgi:hypothetical protein